MVDVGTLRERFALFSFGTHGVGALFSQDADPLIRDRLDRITDEPLSHGQLNQLLILGREAPVSAGFFSYYWLSQNHPVYDVRDLPDYRREAIGGDMIADEAHLRWGLRRLYSDCLLYFGNIRTGFRFFRGHSAAELLQYFTEKSYDAKRLISRGAPLPLREIPKDSRYLISEMACKSFGDQPTSKSELRDALFAAFQEYSQAQKGAISIRALLSGGTVQREYGATQGSLIFSADDALDEIVYDREGLQRQFDRMSDSFLKARAQAIENTKLYLSMVSDLDVYVATSMRTRDDFRRMADTCERIFGSAPVSALNLRYFDPTMSAAAGHEDKGLIECLMVKAAKVLVYVAGEKESYGKDAEAAMALSQGKPVIFLCNSEARSRFYRDIHPLSRLIDFRTGVAVGAMATDNESEVAALLERILTNKMEYVLDQPRPGYFRLRESLTGSIVRLQTNDQLLTEAFWNHYHEPHA